VLHIEEEPVEAGNGHGFRDLDAARHAHANAERQLPLLELFAGDIADSGGLGSSLGLYGRSMATV
jgi:hypothetical protein